ncbi:MAG TPA: glycosyltransferase family 4 protein [Candidatus Limnocylindrales bacterium]|nr:glycosyltransferase family 4 protein [Candidatus Limnocylindrales bacterium]
MFRLTAKPKYKVLFVASIFQHFVAFHLPFFRLLQAKGCEVHAAARSNSGQFPALEELGIICWDIPFARSPYSLANIHAYRQLRVLLTEHHFDLIHVHTPVASLLGRYLARATGQGPVLYTAHGFHFYRGAPPMNWLVYYPAERIAARWTDGLLVMNDEDYKNAQRLGFKTGKNLFYVHGVGVDQNCYVPVAGAASIRAELGLESNDLLVTCVAELIPRKNHVFLLDAWQQLSSHSQGAHLLLIGAGDSMAMLLRKAKQEQIPGVHFLGYRKDVPQILLETDLVTLVSRQEGLPRFIMEAMAAGKPVVATNVRGSRDLVEHGKTGLLVEPGDVKSMTTALKKLIADPSLRTAMGQAGLEKIKDYSLEHVLEEMSIIYEQYLGE